MMMYRYANKIIVLLLAVLILPALAMAGYDTIVISNPFLRKIPLAVPELKSLAGTADEVTVARESADLIARTLEFTCYFSIIDSAAFLEQPKETGIGLSDINLKNWSDIGAEFLVTGSVSLENEDVVYELRMIDVFKAQMLVGKRYKGRISDQRKIIRRFCSEIMERLTGRKGIFDSEIAFVSNGPGNKEIFVCEFDGYNPRRITNNQVIELSPAWSSDGQWLAYTSYRKGKADLYIQNMSDKRGVVFDKPGVNLSPAWRPGRFELAASLSFSGDQEIYLLTGEGKVIKQLTKSWDIDVSPTFSPDGGRLAFVSKRGGTPQLYVMDIASGNTERLTFEGKYNTTPKWSPVDEKVAYSSMEDGQFQIRVVDVGTKQSVRLTDNQGDNESPTWSPDGSLLAFSSTREGGKARIYVMTIAGTDQRRLLTLPGEQTCPAWSLGMTAGQ
jgi:TolB protein